MADPGGGAGGGLPPLFLNQTEAQRAEKNFFAYRTPPPFSGSGFSHCLFCFYLHATAAILTSEMADAETKQVFWNWSGRECRVYYAMRKSKRFLHRHQDKISWQC